MLAPRLVSRSNRTGWLLLLASVTGVEPAAAQKPADAVRKEQERLRGSWKAVAISAGGFRLPLGRGKWVRFVFAGDRLILDDSLKSAPAEGNCRLDPATTPHGIDLTFPGDKPVAGICELDGDTLRICHPPGPDLPRPKEFKSQAPGGKPQLLLVFRRERPGRPLTPIQRKLLKERDDLLPQIEKALDKESPSAAIALLTKKARLEEEIYGYTREQVGLTLLQLAQINAATKQFARARGWAHRSQLVFENLYGARHWKTGEARFYRSHVGELERLSATQRLEVFLALGLESKAEENWHRGQVQAALDFAEKGIASFRKLLGDKHRYTLRLCSDAALFRLKLDRLEEAEKEMRRLLPLLPEVFGKDHPNFAMLLNNLGELRRQRDDLVEAEQLLLRARSILEAAVGKQSPQLFQVLNNLALVHLAREELKEGQALLEQARRLLEAQKIPSFDLATCLCNLADVARKRRQFAESLDLYKQALDQAKQTHGEQSPGYAQILINRVDLFGDQGQFDRVEKDCGRVLALCARAPKETGMIRALALARLAGLHEERGRFLEAEGVCRQALEAYRQTVGERHSLYAGVLRQLAGLHLRRADFARAEQELEQALAIVRRSPGARSLACADCLSELALLYSNRGQYGRATPLLLRVRDLRVALRGKRHPLYASSLEALGRNARQRSDWAEAVNLYRQARSLRGEVQGKEHPAYAHSQLGLGEAERLRGNLDAAEPLLVEACDILRRAKSLSVADAWQQLAELYHDRGDLARAEPLYRQAAERYRTVLGEEHPNHGVALNSLGQLYAEMGDLQQAEKLLQRALAIAEKSLGPAHHTCAVVLNGLAALRWRSRHLDEAVRLRLPLRGAETADTTWRRL